MKIYVAGKFEDKETVLEIYRRLKEKGHEIAYNWTTHKNIKPYVENQETASQYSKNEVDGILNCDCYIYLSSESGHTLFMEFGAAVVLAAKTGKPKIYAVGAFNDKSPWFFHPVVERRETVDEVLKEL